jgi:serine/threonine protein kinase
MSGENPAQLFDLGRVLSDEGPHGLVARAAVSDGMSQLVGAASVAVKILNVGDHFAVALQTRITTLIPSMSHASLVQYHGAWITRGDDVWIVSDLCEGGSVTDIMDAAQIRDHLELEGIASYVMRNVLLAVDFLHTNDVLHGDIRANNFLVDGLGHVKIGDYGVHHVLESALMSRVCYPSARLWPAPELSSGMQYDKVAEVWALGVALLELVEGRRAVQVASRLPAGTASCPRFSDTSPWSAHLREFVKLACTSDRRARATIDSLLQTEFIQRGGQSPLEEAFNAAAMVPTPAESQALYDPKDAVWALRRQNGFVRSPLVNLDDFGADDFVRVDRRVQDNEGIPAAELALRIALENKRLFSEYEPNAKSELARLQTILETIDSARGF